MKLVEIKFWRFLLPFVCIFSMPIIAQFFSNIYVTRINSDKLQSMTMDSIKNQVNIVENNLNYIEDIAFGVGSADEINVFASASTNSPTHRQIEGVSNIFSSYNTSGLAIINMFAYNRASGALVDNNSFYRDIERYLGYKYKPVNEQAIDIANNIKNGLWENGFSEDSLYVFGNGKKHIIHLIRSVPFSKINEKNACIALLIDVDKLLSPFDSFTKKNGSKIYIRDEKNNIIMSNEKSDSNEGDVFRKDAAETSKKSNYHLMNIGKEKMCRFCYYSPETKWCYILYVPQVYLFADNKVIAMVLYVVTILSFLLAIIISAYFAARRQRSYKKVKTMLGLGDDKYSAFAPEQDELTFYHENIKKLLNEKEEINEKFIKLKKYDKERIMYMLLFGYFDDDKTAKQIVEESGLKLQGSKYLVLAIELNTKSINQKNDIEERISHHFGTSVLVSDIDKTYLVVLFAFADSPTEFYSWLYGEISENYKTLFKYYEIGLGAGSVVEKYLDISESYKQAKNVILYNKLLGSKLFFYFDIPSKGSEYSYPDNIEKSIINAVIQSDFEAAKNALDEVYEKNFIEQSLSPQMMVELIHKIYKTLKKIQVNYIKKDYPEYDLKNATVKTFFDYALDFVEKSCVDSSDNAKEEAENLFSEIVMYVKNNYADMDLSLNELSEHFEISTTYISKIFKKNMGIGFYYFLESFRIDKACELLCNSQNAVKDIAVKVGYANDASFRRAFKKRKGMSPRAYISMKE